MTSRCNTHTCFVSSHVNNSSQPLLINWQKSWEEQFNVMFGHNIITSTWNCVQGTIQRFVYIWHWNNVWHNLISNSPDTLTNQCTWRLMFLKSSCCTIVGEDIVWWLSHLCSCRKWLGAERSQITKRSWETWVCLYSNTLVHRPMGDLSITPIHDGGNSVLNVVWLSN